jgi:hypothetical protein
MLDLRIERTGITSPIALTLIEALNAELDQRYPEDLAGHYRFDGNEVAPGRGAFLVAYQDGEAAGCGAVAASMSTRPRSSACTPSRRCVGRAWVAPSLQASRPKLACSA